MKKNIFDIRDSAGNPTGEVRSVHWCIGTVTFMEPPCVLVRKNKKERL